MSYSRSQRDASAPTLARGADELPFEFAALSAAR